MNARIQVQALWYARCRCYRRTRSSMVASPSDSSSTVRASAIVAHILSTRLPLRQWRQPFGSMATYKQTELFEGAWSAQSSLDRME